MKYQGGWVQFVQAAIAVVGAVAGAAGNRKKRKAEEKAAKDAMMLERDRGAQQRQTDLYDAVLAQWKDRKNRASRAAGAQNFAQFGREGPAGPSAVLNEWAQTPGTVAQDPGAMPTADQYNVNTTKTKY